MVIGFILMVFWAFLLHCFVGSFVLFIYSWASLAHLLSLGILGPFSNYAFPWAYTNLLTPLGFPDPITLSFILEAHELSINPLLSLLALLRAYCGPFSLFYITYYPWVCYFSLRAPLGLFASSRPVYLFYGPMIHYSYHLGLMVFQSTH